MIACQVAKLDNLYKVISGFYDCPTENCGLSGGRARIIAVLASGSAPLIIEADESRKIAVYSGRFGLSQI